MNFKYGTTYINVPGEFCEQGIILKPKEIKPLDNPVQAIRNALRNPTSGESINRIVSPGETICIIVNDSTRVARTELILPLVVEELNQSGIPDEDIYVVIAEGLHRPSTCEEMEQIAGKEIASRLRIFNHNAHNADELAYVTTTRRGTPVYINRKVLNADRRIIIGSINYHFFAGFGGGYKSIVPGTAGAETIKANHSLMLDPNATLGILQGNPVHEDLKEAAKSVGCDFLINVVLDESKEILGIFSGDIDTAHLIGCSFVKEIYGAPFKEPADIVLASCGGYPKDINVYQAQKTLENAANAVKDGGVIILVAECREGVGSEKYLRWAQNYKTLSQLESALKNRFEIGGHKAYAVSRVTSRCQVFLISSLDENVTCDLGFCKFTSIEDAIAAALEVAGENPKIFLMPEGAITTPIRAEVTPQTQFSEK